MTLATGHGAVLTIDCDWAVVPTPARLNPYAAPTPDVPAVTYEHVRYAYVDRPEDARHRVSRAPGELLAALRAKGLPKVRRASFSERHGGVRTAWASVLETTDHVVCLDAHLDVYAVGSLAVVLRGPRGKRLRVQHRPHYREMAGGLSSLGYLGPSDSAVASAAAWEEAWPLLLMEHMPLLERLTWVVPDHFAAGLAAGFPYPHAQWKKTLDEGCQAGIWRHALDPDARRIDLYFREPELANRHLAIDLVTLATCPSLAVVNVDQVHVCRSPSFLHPAADRWVKDLVTLLNGDGDL